MSDMPAPSPADDQIAAEPPAPFVSVRLWGAGETAIASAILGFPGGFGIAARNAWRLGRRQSAWLLLLAGMAAFAVIVFAVPDEAPRGAAIGINLGIAAALYLVVRSQVAGARREGHTVERASGASGIATFLGGTVATAGPSILLVITLTFLGSQVQAVLAGTMQFGTAGSGCTVDSPATTLPSNAAVHFVAYLARETRSGETIHVTVRHESAVVDEADIPIDEAADCVSGSLPAGALEAGTWTFEYSIGSERMATGQLVVTAP